MPNRLAHETSPYLQQHADNPVDWFPWGDEALELARQTGKPILLSIGYSACHWCHVMAHECFENPAIAAVMNDLYVNIKVDREERPDLDLIYQNAHNLLAQRGGGWPLTVLLTPDQQIPFFAGTYIPPMARHGLPAFPDLLQRARDFLLENPADVARQSEGLVKALAQMDSPAESNGMELDLAPLDQARDDLEENYDERFGGFGAAPKFPHPTNLEFLIRHWALNAADDPSEDSANTKSLDMAGHTLTRMALGGVYDQLGGGFYRYSVDERWSVPHFEKMLYDNGPLLALYAQAFQATGTRLFRDVALETAEWTMAEMQDELGGYYSTLDADSEGEEGRFYVWDRAEIEKRLSEDEFQVMALRYGLNKEANFEGKWHLNVRMGLEQIAEKMKRSTETVGPLLSSAHAKLFDTREERIRPDRDEKILTSWNGLMIRGMALAGRNLNDPLLFDSAEAALEFIHKTLWKDGRLLATYKDGKAHLNAYLDDYAYLIDAILEFLQARWRTDLLVWATELADVLLAQFEDQDTGGFFFISQDHETLIHRPKPLTDNATPSGNAIATRALYRLGHLLGEHRYTDAAERSLRMAWPAIAANPHHHASWLPMLEEWQHPPQILVLRGNDEKLQAWKERIDRGFAPRRMCFAIGVNEQDLPGLLAERKPLETAVAYVCSGTQCLPPMTDLEDLREHLLPLEASATPRNTTT